MRFTSVCLNAFNSVKSDLAKSIQKHTNISFSHLTPEIGLHLITPECHLWGTSYEQSPFQDPFWAFYWPGGQALSRYLLDNKKLITGRNVLDVGSGSGACAIAAALCGATHVAANDIDNVSCVAIEMNCSLNNVSVEIIDKNLIGDPCNKWNCILVGDMFYDSDFGQEMFLWLKHLSRRRDRVILVGDPGRHAFKESDIGKYLQQVASYTLPDHVCLENNGFNIGAVWKFSS